MLLYVFVAILTAAIGFMWYMGIFTRVGEKDVEDDTIPRMLYVYEFYSGSMKDMGKAFGTHYEEVGSLLTEGDLKNEGGFGIYLEKPENGYCDCVIGTLVEDEKIAEEIIENGTFRHVWVDSFDALSLSFKYRNVLTYMIAPAKAYPVLGEMADCEVNGFPLEFYYCFRGFIKFVMPLEKIPAFEQMAEELALYVKDIKDAIDNEDEIVDEEIEDVKEE
ncbi:hypothetical protein PCE1_000324 [Barthelona sp. PCE]